MYKIIIADDHSIVRQGLKMLLRDEPELEITDEAESGDELLTKIGKDKYDLIILDIGMPGKDVFDTMEQLHRLESKPHVLILTMNPEEVYAKRLMNAGASGYINKDAKSDEIIKAIRKVASGGYYITQTLAESIAPFLQKGGGKTPHENLTSREFQIMSSIAVGKTLTEIADQFFISKATVSNHRTNILRKLNLKNNADVIQYAVKNKLV